MWLAVLPTITVSQAPADEGRIHITFFKAGHGSGSGYLFFQGHKYGLSVSGPKIRKVWITTIDLIGTLRPTCGTRPRSSALTRAPIIKPDRKACKGDASPK